MALIYLMYSIMYRILNKNFNIHTCKSAYTKGYALN